MSEETPPISGVKRGMVVASMRFMRRSASRMASLWVTQRVSYRAIGTPAATYSPRVGLQLGAMKILCHYAASRDFQRQFTDLAPDGLELAVCPVEDLDSYHRLIRETEVLWHLLLPLSAEMIEAGPSLRLIQKIGIGVNTIDLDAARRRGIAVCNMPGTNSQAVAEATLLLMLGALRRAAQGRSDYPHGEWLAPADGAPG